MQELRCLRWASETSAHNQKLRSSESPGHFKNDSPDLEWDIVGHPLGTGFQGYVGYRISSLDKHQRRARTR